MNQQQAADFLCVSVRTVQRYIADKTFRLGKHYARVTKRRLRFDKEALQEWLQAGGVDQQEGSAMKGRRKKKNPRN